MTHSHVTDTTTFDLAHANESLRSELDLRNETLAAAAHDLRSPLSTILMALDLFEEQTPALRGERPLVLMRSSAEYALCIVQQLLEVTTSPHDFGARSVIAVSVGALLQEAVRPHQLAAQKNRIALSTHVPAEPTPVLVHVHDLQRVLANLIGNAIHATPRHGRIHVAVKHHVDEVLVSVSNTGPPPPVDRFERLFEPYSSPGYGSKRGVGLGLAIAKRIVEAYGGRIYAQREDPLTTFAFALPAAHGKENLT